MFFSLAKAYRKRDPASHSLLEIILLYPGIKAIFFHRMAHFLWNLKIPFFPRLVAELSRWLTGIEIHPGAKIGKNIIMDHGMGIVIGETAIIENDVLIYHGVTLGSSKIQCGKRHPTIERGAILGAGCKIIGNIVIGKCAKIGANAVVLTSIPSHKTAVGVPARIISEKDSTHKLWDIEFHI